MIIKELIIKKNNNNNNNSNNNSNKLNKTNRMHLKIYSQGLEICGVELINFKNI